ncbi:MAG: hypothetical protein JWP68_4076 [Modestobacter sp.]|nr:hypothetical protein [Modestobacter sp.]
MPTLTRRQANALRMAAERAGRAPSVRSSRPWEVRLHATRLEVRLDPDRRLPALDPRGREWVMSVGAALLDVRIGMAAAGQAATVARFPDREQADLAAVVRPTDGGPDADLAALATLVEMRHSTWVGSPGAPLACVLGRLAATAEAEQAVLVALDAAQCRLLARLTGIGASAAAGDCALVLTTFQDEPVSWLRAGEALERVLLEALRHGYRARVDGHPIDRTATRGTLRRLLPPGLHPQTVVHVGRAGVRTGVPRRRTVDVVPDLPALPRAAGTGPPALSLDDPEDTPAVAAGTQR